MLDYFLGFIKTHQLIREGEKILLAVSGGVDSMVMVDLFLRTGYPFAVSHVNFGLRGKDSDLDEALVKQWCDKNEIACYTKKVPEDLFENGESTQMIARDFRYQYFRDLMSKHLFQKLATAHHLDDSLETALFNFSKGTGLRGLKGIDVYKNEIIRPLMFIEKQDIIEYAKDRGLAWREDASNEKDAYQRNKIRKHVIPVLKSINPGLVRTFLSVSERIGAAQDLVDDVVEPLLQKYSREQNGTTFISLEWIEKFKNPTIILCEMLRTYGFSYLQITQVHEVIQHGMAGKVFYSGDWVLNLDRQQMILKREGTTVLNDLKLVIPGATIIENQSIESTIISGNQTEDHHDPNIAYLDFDRIIEPKITRWNEGDVFYPLGMKGKKKISDFMIDSKIPLTLKRDVPILRSRGEIVWIVGHRIDDRFKVTPGTKKMLRLQFRGDV